MSKEIFKSYDPNYEEESFGFCELFQTKVHIAPLVVSYEDREILKDNGWEESLWYFYREEWN